MNEIQYARSNSVSNAKARVRRIERELLVAREDLRFAQSRLMTAIAADPDSWCNTPGIIK